MRDPAVLRGKTTAHLAASLASSDSTGLMRAELPLGWGRKKKTWLGQVIALTGSIGKEGKERGGARRRESGIDPGQLRLANSRFSYWQANLLDVTVIRSLI